MKKSTIPKAEEFGHVTVCDINKSMLEVGEDRAQKVNTCKKYMLVCILKIIVDELR